MKRFLSHKILALLIFSAFLLALPHYAVQIYNYYKSVLNYCSINSKKMEIILDAGGDINERIYHSNSGWQFIVTESMFDQKCPFEDQDIIFFLEHGGAVDLKSLKKMIREAKDPERQQLRVYLRKTLAGLRALADD